MGFKFDETAVSGKNKDMGFENTFYEITAILLLAVALGAVGIKLRQPLILTFITVGVLVGPSCLKLVKIDDIKLLAEMGVALLLFIVGLKLDIFMIRAIGPVALITGLGQVAFTSIFGFFIALALGIPIVDSIYIAVTLTFSSTIIIVKLLSDKKEIDSLHGRIIVGFLIVQDIIAIIIMIALSAFGAGGNGKESAIIGIVLVIGKGILLLGATWMIMKFVLPSILKQLARSQELLVLFSVTWAVLAAAACDRLGFSKEMGAFLAGVSLASTPYRDSIGSRLVSLRDFLLLFFFIELGSYLDLSLIGNEITNSAIFSLFVLVGNPLIVMVIMGVMGYRKRTGFLAGLAVAQISEFSLILASLGVSLGHISRNTMGLITIVGLVTIGLSSYMILYSTELYNFLAPLLSVFEKKTVPSRKLDTQRFEGTPLIDVIIFGLGNYGANIARKLLERKKHIVGVDFDPQALEYWRKQGVPVLYGDAEDPEILERLPVTRTRWVLGAMPDRQSNLSLLSVLKRYGFQGKIALGARNQQDADEFEKAGADLVLRPFVDAAEQAADSLTAATHTIPDKTRWHLKLKEVRLEADSLCCGKTIGEIPLRSETGASILAVSRGGKNYFDPEPAFRLFPGDRVALLGEEKSLELASEYFKRREPVERDEREEEEFTITAIEVPPDSSWVGQTLGGLNFRSDYGVTVIGIQREDQQINAPSAKEMIMAGDRLIIAGNKSSVERLSP